MPKFHDEFFKKGSSRHDDLVIKILSFPENLLDNILNPRDVEKEIPVHICEPGDHDYCSLGQKIGSTKIMFCTECQHADRTILLEHIADRELKIKIGSKGKRATKKTVVTYSVNRKETEKICKGNNGFIMGYCDVVYEVRCNKTITIKIKDELDWDYYNEDKDYTIVVDAKPDLKSWGGPLRQIKTYMSCLRADYGVLVSYDNLEDAHKEVLQAERVYFVHIDENDSEKKLGDYF